MNSTQAVDHFIALVTHMLDNTDGWPEDPHLIAYGLGLVHASLSAWCSEDEQRRMLNVVNEQMEKYRQ